MTKYFENGFYLEQNEQKSRIEISDEEWITLLQGQKKGKQIASDGQKLILVDVPENYQKQRLKAYPNPMDFLDAYVKKESGIPELISEGEQQMQKYIKACLDVKNKYPKT